jgi:Flp pilus assembly protein TadD
MGILKMLEGDKEAGLADVQKAFDLNPEENYVRETLVIALMECGQKEKAEELRQQFEAEGIEFDVDFLSYLNGEVSLHDYYVD